MARIAGLIMLAGGLAAAWRAMVWVWKWLTTEECPHCGCRIMREPVTARPPYSNRLVVIERQFACGFGRTPEGQNSSRCWSETGLRSG